jgi:hypothetical protein
MTLKESSKLDDEAANAYLLIGLRSITSAEVFANKELKDAVDGVRLPDIAEQMLKRFKK